MYVLIIIVMHNTFRTQFSLQGFNVKSVRSQGFKLNIWDIGGTMRAWHSPDDLYSCTYIVF